MRAQLADRLRHGRRGARRRALNALAVFDFEAGSIEAAREKFYRALELGGASAELVAAPNRISGSWPTSRARWPRLWHYQRSLEAFESIGDDRGCAIAYHNLGMVSADRELWDDADRYFRRSLQIAEATGDVHLQGLGLLNHAEVHLARQRYEQARAERRSRARASSTGWAPGWTRRMPTR